jgi:hypothetical protein
MATQFRIELDSNGIRELLTSRDMNAYMFQTANEKASRYKGCTYAVKPGHAAVRGRAAVFAGKKAKDPNMAEMAVFG